MSRYPTLIQRFMILQSFETMTTIQRAAQITGLDRDIVYQVLRAAEYRGELRRQSVHDRTVWVRRRCAA